MTYEEVRKICDSMWQADLLNADIQKVREALEKQIPKKPVEERYFGEMGSKIGFCPNCHTGQSCDDNSIQYCYYCSQAIDWSDEE